MLVPLHPLNIMQITNYFNYEPRFNGLFSRNYLPSIKNGAYVKNIYNKNSKGIHWVSFFIDNNTAVYFNSFWIEYIFQEVWNKMKDKLIIYNILRIQDNESIMCGLCCIAFIGYICLQKNFIRLY